MSSRRPGSSPTARSSSSSRRRRPRSAGSTRRTDSSARDLCSHAKSTAPTGISPKCSPSGSSRSTRRSRQNPSPTSSVDSFETFPEQDDAKRLLRTAVADGPAHAYLFHGPAGVGKRRAALAFAGELIGDPDRVARLAHPDLYLLEPLGDQIRIDPIRELRRDLHMRPFEAERRVYVLLGAHLMNEDAADALLKDLEEPPDYAVVVLVADELGPLPETIRSRCQLIPFRRLSERAVREHLASRRGGPPRR